MRTGAADPQRWDESHGGISLPDRGAATAQNDPDASGVATLLATHDVKKSYRKGQNEIPVLQGVDLDVRQGEFLSIVGQSGCGKSTLLHLLGTLDWPDSGEIHLCGERIDNLPARKRDKLRNETFGLVFQFYHLLPETDRAGKCPPPADDQLRPVRVPSAAKDFSPPCGGVARKGSSQPSPQAQAVRTLRRRDAAGGDCPVAGQSSPGYCWRMSRPGISTAKPGRRFSRFCET